MGITDGIKKTLTGMKDFLSSSRKESDDIEFLEKEKAEDELKKLVFRLYESDFKRIEKLSNTWQQNRKAYMGEFIDMMGGKASIQIGGQKPAAYCSSIVQDKVDDLVAMQLQGSPKIYPLPSPVPEVRLSVSKDTGLSGGAFLRKVWEKCFEDLGERINLESTNIEVAKDARLCGISFVKTYQSTPNSRGEAEIKVDVVQPEDFAVDPSATSIKTARRAHHRNHFSLYEAVQEYPDFKEELAKAIIGEDDTTKKRVGKNTISSGGAARDNRDYKGKVCVVESYFRDNSTKAVYETVEEVDEQGNVTPKKRIIGYEKKYPTGRRITFLPGTNTILKDDNNPYSDFPFAAFKTNPISWGFYGHAEATALRQIQILDDRILQQMYVVAKNTGPKIVVEEGALLNEEEFSNEIWEVLKCTHSGAVRIEVPPPALGDLMAMHNLLRREADQISGIFAPSEGRQTASLTSGRAIGLLQEGGNRKVRPSQILFGAFLKEVGQQIADLMKDLYREGRKLRVAEDDGTPVILPFNLSDATESIDIVVGNDAQFPIDPVSRFNMYMTLMQTKGEDGYPLADREAVLDALNFPGKADIIRRIKAREQMMQQQAQQNAQGAQGVNAMRQLESNMGRQQTSGQPAPPAGMEGGGMGLPPQMPTESMPVQ